MRFNQLSTLFVVGLIALQASSLRAERRPDPPPPLESPKVERPPEGFLNAYRKLGSPRLLMYAYMLPMDDTNELGTLKAFEARFRPFFIHPEVTMVFENQSHFRDARDFADLAQKNTIEAAKLVSRETPADYVILVAFIRQGGRERNVKYTQTYELHDVKRGTLIGTFSWEMSPPKSNQDGVVDVRRLEQYAEQLAVRITDDFKTAVGGSRLEDPCGAAARSFTLRITGLQGNRLAEIRSLLRQIECVKDVIRPETDQNGHKFDVRFAGDALDLSEAVRAAVEAGLGMNASFLISDEGLIVVEVWPVTSTNEPILGGDPTPGSPATTCETLLNGDDDNQANATERARFSRAYTKCNEPQIGIMINKEANRDELRESARTDAPSTSPSGAGGIGSPGTAGQNTVVCIQCRVGDDEKTSADPAPTATPITSTPTDDAYLNAREMEDRLFRRFGVLKLERVDLKVAFNNLRAQQRLTKEVYDEGELARLLGEEAKAQVVIAGAGKVVRFQSNVEVRYTFRAYEMSSARILATATVNRTINSRISDVNEATESMAAETVGKLACQIMEICEPPSRIKVELSGARSAKDVIEAMKAVQKIPGVERTIFRGYVEGKDKPGVGFMQIIYAVKCEELIDQISGAPDLPFHLDSRSTDCDTLRLKAVDK